MGRATFSRRLFAIVPGAVVTTGAAGADERLARAHHLRGDKIGQERQIGRAHV